LNTLGIQAKISRQIVRKYEMLKSYYKAYERLSPTNFYDIFSNIDYGVFVSVISGEAEKDDVGKTEIYLDAALRTIREKTLQLKGVIGGLNSVLELHNNLDKSPEDTGKSREEEAEERRKQRREAREKTGKPVKEEQKGTLDGIM
jgi:hypothetical protein